MRIIAGDWKGHRLKTVPGIRTRPTADKVKGAIFNILGGKVAQARVLDLFAGTGNLAFEALSRGARNGVLVERNNKACEVIRENQNLLGAEGRTQILKMDALTFLKQYREEPFDLIFLDPPYHQGLPDLVLNMLRGKHFLNPQGVIVVETATDENILEGLFPLELMLTKEYGDTKIWFLQEIEEQEEE